MYALWEIQGVTVRPWCPDVRFGAVRDGPRLRLVVAADRVWEGRVVFDRPRYREFMKLPLDDPRINQFPEWFVVEAERRYRCRNAATGAEAVRSGHGMAEGVPLCVEAGREVRWTVEAKDSP